MKQFKQGVIDSLRIPQALITIMNDKTLKDLTVKCTVLNGMLWLGSILVY